MRIAYLCLDSGIPVLGGKGASVHVRAFVTALGRLGHEVRIFCTRPGDGNPAPAPLTALERPSREAAIAACMGRGLAPAVLEDEALASELRRIAHDEVLPAQMRAAFGAWRPDLIIERHALFHAAGAEIARTLAIPRLLEVNAPLVEEQAAFRTLRLRALAEEVEARSMQAAQGVVAVSAPVAAYVRGRGVAAERIMVAPNGVDCALFAPEDAGAEVRAFHGLGAGPVIGFFGSFKVWHGVDFLLDAFAVIAAEHAQARLLCLGHGPRLEAVEARAAALGLAGRAIFPGPVPHAEVPAHLAAMDLTVAPYLPQEDFYFSPLKVVESLAAGRPVVAPRMGQIPELIEDGETGLLYEPGDLAACTGAIRRLIEDPSRRRRMGAAGAARAQACWDWQQVARAVLARLAPGTMTEAA